MTHSHGRSFLLALAACGVVAYVPFGLPGPRGPAVVRFVILHTNDVHGQVRPIEGKKADKPRGGFPALARVIRHERDELAREGVESVLVDTGDIWQGPPEGTRTEGGFVMGFMNRMGYDVGTVGNHEFDHGPAIVERLVSFAAHPMVAANIAEARTGRAWLRPSVVRTVAGLRVRFIGLCTSGIEKVTIAGATRGLRFGDEARTVERELARGPGADLVVLVSHCGDGVDAKLAERFKGRVAVIVGGHSHRPIDPAWHVPEGAPDAVLVAQTGARTTSLGRIDIEYDRRTRRVARSSGRLLPVLPADGEDPEIAALAHAEEAVVDRLLGMRVGTLSAPLDRSGAGSSTLGDFVCDAMRAACGADVAFTNRSGLRADLAEGDVKLRNLHEVDPFGNTLVVMRYKGSELLAFLEEQCARNVLETSGLALEYDRGLPRGRRVVKALVNGKAIDPEGEYVVCTNSFLAGGGDGYGGFGGRPQRDTGQPVRDAIRAYLEKQPRFDPPSPRERVVDLAR